MQRVLNLIQQLAIAIETKDQLPQERLEKMTNRIWAGAEFLKTEGIFFSNDVTAHSKIPEEVMDAYADKVEKLIHSAIG